MMTNSISTELFFSGNEFFNKEKFPEAIQKYKEALDANDGKDIELEITIANNMGHAYRRIGNYEEPAKLYNKSIRLARERYGKESQQVCDFLSFLVDNYSEEGAHKKAQQACRDMLKIQRKTLPEDDPHLLETLSNLAELYYNSKNYFYAEKFFVEAIDKSEKFNDPDSNITLNLKFRLANVYYHNQIYDKAIQHLKKMLVTYENKEEDWDFAMMRKHLADCLYCVRGKYREAAQYYLEAAEIFGRVVGENAEMTIKSFYDLACLYFWKLNSFLEAEKFFKIVVQRTENHLSRDSYLNINSLIYLGELYYEYFKNNDQSREYFQKALDIIINSDQDDKENEINIYYYFTKILLDENQREEAEKILKKTVELSKSVYGLRHPGTNKLILLQIKEFPTSPFSRQLALESKSGSSKNNYFKYLSGAFNEQVRANRVRVFISSTFKDMMPEREYLGKTVFPKLRKICKKRGIDFNEVDLRWGITEEDAEKGKVLAICLNEIDKSRPFFIGMLGERYGWIPQPEFIDNFKHTLENYDWLEKVLQEGLSLTEMEFQYGALRNPKSGGNAYFYIRDKDTGDANEIDEMSGSTELKKLDHLKNTLRRQELIPVKNYRSLEELGDSIFENLRLGIFGDDYPDNELSILEEERNSQVNFIKNHIAFYQGNKNAYKALDRFVNRNPGKLFSRSNKMVLYGSKGTGKTALLANYIKNNFENSYFLFHFVEADLNKNSSSEISKRIINEMNALGFTEMSLDNDDFPNTSAILETIFKQIDSDLVIVIDGLEKMRSNDFFSKLYWLPEKIPPKVKLILSTNNQGIFDKLKKKGFSAITLKTLARSSRKSFVVDYLGKSGKKLPGNIIDKIVHDEVSAVPFTLKLFLDELRVFGIYEKLESFTDNYLAANGTVELYIKIFERMEQDYEHKYNGLVGSALSFIALSKMGLTEQEIIDLTGSAQLYWSPIYNSLENSLHRDLGRISILNEHFLEAVNIKYLTSQEKSLHFHRKMAEYFHGINDNERKYEELGYHLNKLGDREGLKTHLSDIPIFMYYLNRNPIEFFMYWDELKKTYDFPGTYREAIINYEKLPGVSPMDVAAALKKIGRVLELEGRNKDSLFFWEKNLKIIEDFYGSDHMETALAIVDLGKHSKFLKVNDSLEKNALKAIAILESKHAGKKQLISLYSTLSEIYLDQEKFELAEEYALKVKNAVEDQYKGESFVSVIYYFKQANINFYKSNYDIAQEYCEKAIDITDRFGGKEHMVMGWVLTILAQVYCEKDMNSKALPHYREAIRILNNTLGENHVSVLTLKPMMAMTLLKTGMVNEAVDVLNENFEKSKSLLGDDHNVTQTSRKLLESLER